MDLIYLFCYLHLILFYFINSQSKSSRSWRIIVGMFPALIIVSLRGSVGTDSANYQSFYTALDKIDITNLNIVEIQSLKLEPAFMLLVKFISLISSDPIFIQSIVSLLCGLLCLTAFLKIQKEGFFFVFLCFPNFYLDMTMNGIRYGIAFTTFVFILSCLGKSRFGKVILLITPFFHITAIFLMILNNMGKISLSKLILVFSTLIIAYYFLFARAEEKLSNYTGYTSPDFFSGIVPFSIVLVSFGILIFFCDTKQEVNLNMYRLLIIQSLFFILARFSYAGLRLEWLLLFFMSYFLNTSLSLHQIKMSKIGLNCFVLLGLSSFACHYRYYVLEYGQGLSPFLPYRFFWQ